jgi:hypothetical protein
VLEAYALMASKDKQRIDTGIYSPSFPACSLIILSQRLLHSRTYLIAATQSAKQRLHTAATQLFHLECVSAALNNLLRVAQDDRDYVPALLGLANAYVLQQQVLSVRGS